MSDEVNFEGIVSGFNSDESTARAFYYYHRGEFWKTLHQIAKIATASLLLPFLVCCWVAAFRYLL